MKSQAIDYLLESMDIQPILIDIGASGSPPKIWEKISRRSIYIGFDPDKRDIPDIDNGFYRKSTIIAKAVTAKTRDEEITFHLTSSPYCSSTLEPDQDSLSNYLFSDLFRVERQVEVQAISLNSVVQDLSLPCIDWFKTDSQGTDLSLFNSLRAETRSRVLAVDMEPGLIDAYKGEDLFVDVQRELIRNGFWLSNFNLCGATRMRRSNLEAARAISSRINAEVIDQAVRPSPGWCEIRYLRTLEWMQQTGLSQREYVLLWVFSLLDNQPGFAFDLAIEYERIFGKSKAAKIMKEEPVAIMAKPSQSWRRRFLRIRQLI